MSSSVDLHRMELASAADALVLSQADLEWYDTGGGYELYVVSEEADFGQVDEELAEAASALLDGEIEAVDRVGNRELVFVVFVRAKTAAGLAEGERVLSLACRSATTLRWTPPAADGEVTVYDLIRARIQGGWTRLADDRSESGQLSDPVRAFRLTLTAYPHPRSVDQVTVLPAGSGSGTTPPTPVVTTIYDGSTIAGWTGSNGTSTTITPAPGGGVQTQATPTNGVAAWHHLTRAVTMDLATQGRWIAVTAVTTSGGSDPLVLIANGATSLSAWRLPDMRLGGESWYWVRDLASITRLRFQAVGNGRLTVRSVKQYTVMPTVSTARETLRQFEVQGTERTQARIAVAHDTVALGDVLVCTWPEGGDGYAPATGRYVNTGLSPAQVADADAAMGYRMTVTSTAKAVYDIAADYLPASTYSVLVRAKVAAAGNLPVRASASLQLGGASLSPVSVQAHRAWQTGYTVQAVGQIGLPPASVPRGTGATVRLDLSTPGATSGLQIDSVYLVDAERCDLTLVNCGAGTPAAGGASSRLWVEPPTIAQPRPTVMVGTQADLSDARQVNGLQHVPALRHELTPGRMNAFVVSAAYNAATTIRHEVRWTQNAAGIEVEL